ncbi:dihydrofolate reductase [Haloarcula sp. CBA1130]|uniref:dihydrofolate reductase n=1 Tax=unclassified Haloarcula TaxID=2624677 RepID=UPI00124588A5|nr:MULTISPECIES: dihydrofolate reductase [unclassified Haloarcula]KAA9395908.1 dihydrofolate reductase [Haloarcula sp. CBA1129]KAA9400163.1 dihydrofolate reductase [Haloarcula sp. CBA1130]
MKLSLIAAVAANGVIGAGGDIPWQYPEDLTHFKQTTVNHPVIMGRRTFESIRCDLGGPLPERLNIVLTSTPQRLPDSVTAVTSTTAALAEAADSGASTTYVVGGATVYEQFLPAADELILTELTAAFDGDTVFPTVEWSDWTETDRTTHPEFAIVRYTRTGSDSA